MCCVKLKHCRSSKNSVAGSFSVLSQNLKLTRRRTDGEVAGSWVKKSARGKEGFGLAGQGQ